MLDHMSGGRADAGFARGYQRRWVDTMAQQAHGVRGVQPHEHDAIDVDPSYMEAFATSIPVSWQTSVWNSNMYCSVPCEISGWYGVYDVKNSDRCIRWSTIVGE